MNDYVAALRKYMAENPSNYGSDTNSILLPITTNATTQTPMP